MGNISKKEVQNHNQEQNTTKLITGKKLSSAGAVFDPIKMRWLYGNTSQYVSTQSQVFKDGYEDPTYLTFRVEFGDWGASVLDKTTFAGISESGTILNALHSNYDVLPMGLLDLHKMPENLNGYNHYSFNLQRYYSAYNYLLNRNEDTRAQYLDMFVTGLYEIQHDTPYIFQNIQGLDTLSSFNNQSGMRLKDATISIECIEGLAMKMKTLMELYRKAAWDDVWQRWVLPENMREFKMIIYVYERRIFHTGMNMNNLQATGNGDLYSGGYQSQYDKNLMDKNTWKNLLHDFGNSIKDAFTTNYATGNSYSSYSNDIDNANYLYMSRDEILNRDIPVYAFECAPCEFVIENHFSNTYDAGFTTPEEKTTIKIKVKNVNTFYRNGLLNDALYGNLMIYDLIDAFDRENAKSGLTSTTESETLNSRRKHYLNKSILLENEDMHKSVLGRFSFGLSRTEIAGRVIQYWSSQMGWAAQTKGGSPFVDTIQASAPDANKTNTEILNALQTGNLSNVPAHAAWWHEATVVGQNYWRNGKFLKNLWKLITARTTQIRTSLPYDNGESAVYNNLLYYIDYNGSPAHDYFTTAIENARSIHDMDSLVDKGRNTTLSTDKNLLKPEYTNYSSKSTELHDTSVGIQSIDSSALTGGDESWATVEYDENGNVKGNDFRDINQYKGTNVRHKSPWTWNGIDSETLSGNTVSKGSDKPFEIKTKISDKSEYVSKAIQSTNNIGQEYDLNPHKPFKGKLNSPELKNRMINTSINAGKIDSEYLTEHDRSWATNYDDINEHVVIDGKDMPNLSNTGRTIKDTSAMNMMDKDRELHTPDMAQLDSTSAPRVKDMAYNVIKPRVLPESKIEETLLDEPRVYNASIPYMDNKPRTIKDISLNTPDMSQRSIDNNISTIQENPRNIKNEITTDIPKERLLSKQNITQIDNTQRTFNKDIQNTSIDGRIIKEHDIENTSYIERTIKNEIPYNKFDDERKQGEFQLVETNQNLRNIPNSSLNQVDQKQRTIADSTLDYSLQDERDGSVKQFNVVDQTQRTQKQNILENVNQEEREIKEHVPLNVPDKPRTIKNSQPVSVDQTQRNSDMHNIMDMPQKERELHDYNLLGPEYKEKTKVTALNRQELIKTIMQTVSKPSDMFNQIDQETKEIEDTTRQQLLDSGKLQQIDVNDEKYKNDKNLEAIISAKALIDENGEIKEHLHTTISKLQSELKQQTLNQVRIIEPVPMNKLDNTEREQGDNIIMPVEQVERIKQNAILAGIPEQEVRKMSYKGLITLDESLRNALDDTVLITTTIEKSKRNSATEITNDERDNVKRVRIVDNKARPRLGHKIEKESDN